jgi:hypothetical protein
MEFQPPEFADVPYGTITAAACAPRIADPRFSGVVIRMPDQIHAKKSEKITIPICGYYQLPTAPLLMGADIYIHVRGVGPAALPPISGKVVTDMGKNAPSVPNPRAKQPIDPSRYKGQVSESYFYFDAQRYLPHAIPPGTYEVCVSYGQTTSNVARVTITTP